MRRNLDVEATVVGKWVGLAPVLDERARRLWAGAETAHPGLTAALEQLVEPLTRGDPTSPLRWTCKSRANLTAALTKQGWQVSSTTVGRLLHVLGYSLQSVRKSREGTSHPDRNAQFELINATAAAFLQDGQPVISVDTRKKELVGDFRNAGQAWQPAGTPETARVHDFPTDAIGKAIPYGVYDMARTDAWVSVGRDQDTPAFAVALIGHTRTAAGLRVKATLDPMTYPTGVIVTRAQMKDLSLHPHDFHGEWNYELRPRRS